jgi:hypothetical protein
MRSAQIVLLSRRRQLAARSVISSGTTASSSAGVSRSTAQRMPSDEPYRFWLLIIVGLSAMSLACLGVIVWGLMQAASVVFG